jgi:hypothetical protein
MSSNKKEATGAGDEKFTPITTQEQLNTVIAERIERAKKTAIEPFADYETLKAKAAQFDQAENDKKSADDKNADAIAALQKELADSRSEATKARIQAKYSISDDDADLFLTASDSDALERQAKTLAERVADRKKGAPYVPEQQSQTDVPKDALREFAKSVFKSRDD